MKARTKKFAALLAVLGLAFSALALCLGTAAADDGFAVNDTAGLHDVGGNPYATSSNWLGISFKNMANISQIGDLQNVSVEEGTVFGDYVVIKKIGGEAKTVTEWRAENAAYIARIHGYGSAIALCFDVTAELGPDNIEYVTLKAGFRLYDGTGSGTAWPGDWTSTGVEKEGTKLTSDVTLVLDHASNCYQPALAGYPGAVEEGALTVTAEPTTQEYALNATFDPAGMQVTARIYDGTTRVVDVTSSMVSYDFSEAGTRTVTVSYGGGTVTYDVTVTGETDLSFTVKDGYKTEYFFGDTFDYSSLTLEVTTNEGNTYEVAGTDPRVSVSGFDSTKVAHGATEALEQTLTVSYNGLADQTITVTISDRAAEKPLTAVYGEDVRSDYFQVTFFVQSPVSGLGKDVWGVQNSDFVKDMFLITVEKDGERHEDLTFDEVNALFGANGAGKYPLERAVMNYEDAEGGYHLQFRMHMDGDLRPSGILGITFLRGLKWYNGGPGGPSGLTEGVMLEETVCFAQADGKMVRATESIELIGAPDKTTYTQGESFDPAGVQVKAFYADGKDETFDLTAALCAYDFSTAGDKTVTVSYNGCTAEIGISVLDEWDVSFTVKDGYKTEYLFGDPFDYSTLTLLVQTNKGNSREVAGTDPAVAVSGFDSTAVAHGAAEALEQTLTVSYGGLTDQTITVTISDRELAFALEVDYGTTFYNNDFAEIWFKNPGSIEGLKQLWSVNNCEFVGDYVLFTYRDPDGVIHEDQTVAAVKAALGENAIKRLMFTQAGGAPAIRIHFDDKATLDGYDILGITLKRGMFWYTFPGDATNDTDWVNFTQMITLGVQEDICIAIAGNTVVRAVESLELTEEASKKVYYLGEIFNPAGAEIKVTYRDGGTEILAVTPEMCTALDTSVSGNDLSVTVTVGNETLEMTGFSVREVSVESIEISALPATTEYKLGAALDLTGAKLRLNLRDESGVTSSEEIDLMASMIGAYDAYTVGEKEITVSYAGMTCTFSIFYEDLAPERTLEVSRNSNSTYQEGEIYSICLTLQYNNISTSRKAIWYVDRATNADEKISLYVRIGESEEYVWKTFGELKATVGSDGMALATRIAAYGDTLIFHLDSADLTYEDVAMIKVEEGFYMCQSDRDYWGTDGSATYTPMEDAIFRRDCIVTLNANGRKWIRAISEAEDAVTVVSLPEKTEYVVGERVNPTGLVIHVKYLDGFEEDINLTVNDTPQPTLDEVGEVTVTAYYNGVPVTFNVTVSEESETPDPSGCSEGCGGSAAGSLTASLLLILGAAAIFLKTRKA